ncbi:MULTISPECIES: hypothetical protein [unclassified Serratia (in: enterobacteria)]|uniref:hypothetical protein n=1 Tax=unclassified Serratia (in: enterobacteria) TaxID=2647522 RepID=UPI003F9F3115
MDNKLSELSKPVMYVVRTLGGSVASVKLHSYTAPNGFTSEPLYSQEYVSALLAELEAKDKRIAELERANTSQDDHINQQQDRIDSLEKKNAGLGRRLGDAEKRLATPVRLPDMRQSSSGDRYQWSDGAHNYRLDVISMLLGAGFTVAVEGDE